MESTGTTGQNLVMSTTRFLDFSERAFERCRFVLPYTQKFCLNFSVIFPPLRLLMKDFPDSPISRVFSVLLHSLLLIRYAIADASYFDSTRNSLIQCTIFDYPFPTLKHHAMTMTRKGTLFIDETPPTNDDFCQPTPTPTPLSLP